MLCFSVREAESFYSSSSADSGNFVADLFQSEEVKSLSTEEKMAELGKASSAFDAPLILSKHGFM